MYNFFTERGSDSTIYDPEMAEITPEMDVAWFLKTLFTNIDGDFLPISYNLLKSRLVKSKRNRHLTRAVF